MPYLVADKYKTYTQVGTPFTLSSHQYIRTKHTCDHCGGSGYYATFGTCYKCNGTGALVEDVRIYTPEEYQKYQAALARKREKRLQEQEQKNFELMSNSEINKREVAEKLGFNSDTLLTYIPIGNTYEIKDTLKSLNYKYHPVLGWHAAAPNYTEAQHLTFAFDNLYEWYPLTKYAELRPDAESIIKAAVEAASPSLGNHCGGIGERIRDYTVRLDEARQVCDGTCNLFKFTTVNDKYTFIWLTSTTPKVKNTGEQPRVGETYLLTATIKSHDCSNGLKTTKINRAIIKKEEDN